MADNVIDQIPMLSPEKRQEAREQAIELVIRRAGPRPDRKDFANRRVSPYPAWVLGISLFFLIALFVVTFIPSAFRVFSAGRDAFLKGLPDQHVQAAAAGFAIFAMAEITVILSTIVQKVWYEDEDPRILNAAILLGVLITLFGNIVIGKPSTDNLSFQTIFEWLETVGPSVIVFITSYILKKIMFRSMEHRSQNEADYQEALKAWEKKVSNPEEDPKFMQIYGSVIRDMITKQFVVGAKANERRELLNGLTNKEWLEIFIRELRQENWVPTNIVFEQESVVVDADGRSEVGPQQAPLSASPQPSYGFKVPYSND